MVASGLTEKVVNDKVGGKNAPRQFSELIWAFKRVSLFQTLSFYFPPCGKIPPPVIMVQNVSFRYSDNTVSILTVVPKTEA